MPFNQITPMSAIQSYMQERIEMNEQLILERLMYAGEACVREARTARTYKDRTGNLTSSMGYVVVNNGNIVQASSFEQVKSGSEGSTGGEAFAKEIAGKNIKGLVLIVVAGMNYAKYVAAKGYNVLDSSEDLAESLVPQLMKQLGFTVK